MADTIPFYVNVFEVYPINRAGSVDIEDMTDQHEAQSVREILTKFAMQGVTNQQEPISSKYADEFADDIDINDPRIDNLLDSPDLSDLDEMEMADFINQNTEEVPRSEFYKSESKNPEPTVEPGIPGSTQPTDNQ